MKKACNPLIRYFMLVAGILLLLTVIVPHHHHEDGTPCLHFASAEADHQHATDGDTHQHADCGGSGHTIVFNSNSQGHSSDDLLPMFLMPLFTLVDYVYPPQTTLATTDVYADKAIYIESLHDTWIPAATGLRAPPAIIG